jgi:hypothetical protein
MLLFTFLAGCERALIDNNPTNSPQGNFESLYQNVKNKYSFFALKGIDWDSVKTHYQPQVTPNMSDQALFDVLDSMLYDLRDGHVNLISPFDLGRNWQWYLNYPVNFNFDVVERNYLSEGHTIAGGLRYAIIDSIGYVYYGSFSSALTTTGLNAMLEHFKDTKGLIVDVRNNGGGSLSNAYALAQRLIPEKKEVLRTYDKTGPDPNDFGNGVSITLSPSSQGYYSKPIAILINRSCYSATTFFSGMMSNFEHVTLIGDQTGGGGGLPIDFELPNGWYYRFSGSVSVLPNGYNIELGIIPDIPLNNNPVLNAQGTDEILERALDELR